MKSKKPAKRVKPATLQLPCIRVTQGAHSFAIMAINAKKLWDIVEINQRNPDKKTGYQRVLSTARVAAIARYFVGGKPIPTSILISFSESEFSADGNFLLVPNKPDAGWVIDGQHRLAGAHESKMDIELPVVAFINLAEDEQIKQFVKINKEAKNVPTSLYLDLLRHLPDKSDADTSKERAVDIADNLRRDTESPFSGRIAFTGAPKVGEISLTNFVRKIAPMVSKKGKFSVYSVNEQIGIMKNYYRALEHVFPDIYNPKQGVSVYFKTLGFGAMTNVLPTIFDLCLKNSKDFKVESIAKLLKQVDDFAFEEWDNIGTGTEAEVSAAGDFRESLMARISDSDGGQATSVLL